MKASQLFQRTAAAVVASLAFTAHAELTPPRGAADPRIRAVEYNATQVVRIVTFFGVSTHIDFGAERITSVAIGDSAAWRAEERGTHLFLRPQAVKPDTNMTVITDRRTYHFVLAIEPRSIKDPKAWADPNLTYSLSFKHPEDERRAKEAAGRASMLRERQGDIKASLAGARLSVRNSDYWVKGSEAVSPSAAYDDGRFVYLVFANNVDMPAVYSVDDAGKEALINTHVVDVNTIAVQRLVKRLMLRKGDAAAEVVNQSFDPQGGADNRTGTVSADVERVVRGVN